MKRTTIKKWSFRILLIIVSIAVISVIWVNHQLETIRGSFTKLVDASSLVNTTPSILIKNVNILSNDCSYFITNQNVILENGIITAIIQDTILNRNHETIDGSGKYLIPGLVDSHVHLTNSKNDLLLYLANGVTSVREMLGTQTHLNWREDIKKGDIGPSIFVASEKINSKSGIAGRFEDWTRTRINYAANNAAQKTIKKLSEQGFDAIKIGSFINAEMYDATIKAAKENNIPVVGHIPYSVGLKKTYTSGQVEIAHVEEITKNTMQDFGGMRGENADEYLKYLKKHCDEIAIQIKKNNIAVATTVWLMESLPKQKFDLEAIVKDVELKYANPATVEGTKLSQGWLPGNNYYELSEETLSDPVKLKASKKFWKTYVEAIHIMTKALVDNDVLILAGTDASTALTIPGFSLHDELQSLTTSGLSTTQAIYSATVAPAKLMSTNTGKIQIGKKADLILLSKNPLEKIQNTKTIESVFFGNHWINKSQIDALLNAIEIANENSRSIDISDF